MSDIIGVGSLPCICLFTFPGAHMTNRGNKMSNFIKKKKKKKRPMQHSALSTSAKLLAMLCSPQSTAFYHRAGITTGIFDGVTICGNFTLWP